MVRAVEWPETVEALREYRRGGAQALAAGCVLMALGLAVGVAAGGVERGWPGFLFAAVGLVAVGAGASSWPMLRRFRRVLGAGTWSAHAAVAWADDWKGETVVLAAPDGGERWPLRVVASRQRWTPVRPVTPGVLWWCGDPLVGGVLALPGGGPLFWARPLRGEAVRRRVLEHSEETGLTASDLRMPAPPVPATPGPPDAVSAEAGAARRKEFRRRLTGRWRWVLVVSSVVLALAWQWTDADDADPQIGLTVVSEEADGSCVVRWKDPWDGRVRTGPFACDPARDPLLADWENAFVVSYGPWKGDLYGYVGGRRVGSDPYGTVEAMGLGSLSGLLVGLVGAWWSFWHRRARLRRVVRDAVAVPQDSRTV
ncbi:hypothetical protein AB0M64_21435 [Streptomyces sp. NPDC051771]|uniref:hypothetical protein n=1 Tax=Streptomyces sp. NPDC051771 TaxID=3154847 RepID=UPI00344277E4